MEIDSLDAYKCQLHTRCIQIESHDFHFDKKSAERDAKNCYKNYLKVVGRTETDDGYRIFSTTFTKIVIKK